MWSAHLEPLRVVEDADEGGNTFLYSEFNPKFKDKTAQALNQKKKHTQRSGTSLFVAHANDP